MRAPPDRPAGRRHRDRHGGVGAARASGHDERDVGAGCVVTQPERRAPGRRSGSPRRLGREQLGPAEHRQPAEQGARGRRRARLADRQRSSRAVELHLASRRPRSCRRAPRRARRAAAMTTGSASSSSSSTVLSRSATASGRLGDRGHPDVDRVGPRVGRDLRVGRAQHGLAEPVGDQRLADAGEPERRGRPGPRPGRAPGSRGSTSSRHIGRISRGGPGSATITRPSGRSTHQPGAVPFGLASASADGISHACFRLISAKGMPAPVPQARAASASSVGSTAGVLAPDAAIDSRVRSSGVGPEAARRRRRGRPGRARPEGVARRLPGGRAAAVSRPTSTPAAVSDRASSPAFVSRVSPLVISVPIARISALASRRSGFGGKASMARATAPAARRRADRGPGTRWYLRRRCARPWPAPVSCAPADPLPRSRARRTTMEWPMTSADRSGFSEFDRLLELVRSTRLVLHSVLGAGELPVGGADFLARRDPAPRRGDRSRRPRLGARRHGRRRRAAASSLTSSRPAPGDPARDAGRGQGGLFEAELDRVRLGEPGAVSRADPFTLVALAHARLVFAFLPRLPAAGGPLPVRPPDVRRHPDAARAGGARPSGSRSSNGSSGRSPAGRPVRPVDPAVAGPTASSTPPSGSDAQTFPPAA